jgi:hypothetical protein
VTAQDAPESARGEPARGWYGEHDQDERAECYGARTSLAEAGYEQVDDIDEIITRMPTPAETDRLGIAPGTPVAEHIRTSYTAADNINTPFQPERHRARQRGSTLSRYMVEACPLRLLDGRLLIRYGWTSLTPVTLLVPTGPRIA